MADSEAQTKRMMSGGSPYRPHIRKIAKVYLMNGENMSQTVRDVRAWGGVFAQIKLDTLARWVAENTHEFMTVCAELREEVARERELERATDERLWVPGEIKQAQADLIDIRAESLSTRNGDGIPYCQACQRGKSPDRRLIAVLADQARKQGEYVLKLQEFGMVVKNPKGADVAAAANKYFVDRMRRATEGRPDLRKAIDETMTLMRQQPV